MSAVHIQSRARIAGSTLAFTSSVTAGNLLIVGCAAEGSVDPLTVTDNFGTTYTKMDARTGDANNLAVYAGLAAGSGTCTVTVTGLGGSATWHRMVMSEFSGASVPKDSSANSINNTSPATVNITTVDSSVMVWAAVAGFDGSNTFSAGAGFTLAVQVNGADSAAAEYQTGMSAGSHTVNMNITAGGTGTIPMVAVGFSEVVHLQLLAGNPATATLGLGYSQLIANTVNAEGPLTYTITVGTLPTGLSMAANGTLSGTATQTGTFPVTVQVTDTVTTVSGPYIVHVLDTGDIGPHDLTSYTSHSPFVVSASGEALPAWRAFTALYSVGSTDRWSTSGTTGYLQLDTGTAWSEHIVAVVIQASYNGFELDQTPKDFTIQGSRDGASFTTFATFTNQTGWLASEARRFSCDSVVGYRILRLVVSAVNGGSFVTVGRLSFYRPGPHANTPIVGMSMVVWHSFTSVDYPARAFLYLGTPSNTPGSVLVPGPTIIYLDGTVIPETAFAYALDFNGDLSQFGVSISTDGVTIDNSTTVLWASVYGSAPGTGLNQQFVFGCYFRAYFADGSHRYAFPSIAEVELFTTGGVDDPNLSIDLSLDTASRVFRDFFSGLSTPAYLRISGFGPLLDVVPSCNSPSQGTVGAVYSHMFTVSGGLAPFVWTVVGGSLPPGLSLGDSGVVSGIPTASGTFPFSLQVTSNVFSIDIPHEETTDVFIDCAITIVSAGPCPEGTGSQIGPG